MRPRRHDDNCCRRGMCSSTAAAAAAPFRRVVSPSSLLFVWLSLSCLLLVVCTAPADAASVKRRLVRHRSTVAALFADADTCVNGGEVSDDPDQATTAAALPATTAGVTGASRAGTHCACPVYYTGDHCEQRQCPHSVTGHGPQRIAPVNPSTMRCDHCDTSVYDGMNCQLCLNHAACDVTRGQQCNQSLVVHGTSKQFECSLDSPYFLRLMGDDRNITAQILINCTTADAAVFRDKDNGVCHMAIYRVEPDASYVDPFFRCDTTSCSMRHGIVDKGDDDDSSDDEDDDDDEDSDEDSDGSGKRERRARRAWRARVTRAVRVAGQVTLVLLCASLAAVGAASSSPQARCRRRMRRVMLALATTIAVTAFVYVLVMILAMQARPAVETVVYECKHTHCACAEDPPSQYQPICSQSDVLARSILPSITNNVRIACELGSNACELTLADLSLVFDARCRASECVNTSAYPYWPPTGNRDDDDGGASSAAHRALRVVVALLFALGLLTCVGVLAHWLLTRWRSRALADEFVLHFRLPHSTVAATDDDDDAGSADGDDGDDDAAARVRRRQRGGDGVHVDISNDSFDSDVGGLSPAVLPVSVTNATSTNTNTTGAAAERQPLLSRSHDTRTGSDASAWVATGRAASGSAVMTTATASLRHASPSQQQQHDGTRTTAAACVGGITRHSDASHVSDSVQRRAEARRRRQPPPSHEVATRMAQLRRIARAPLELRAQNLQYMLSSSSNSSSSSSVVAAGRRGNNDQDDTSHSHTDEGASRCPPRTTTATATTSAAAVMVACPRSSRDNHNHNNNNNNSNNNNNNNNNNCTHDDDEAGRRVILHAVDFTIHSGEVLAIMGPSGAGKTTLLDLLAARAKAGVVGGTVYLNGTPVTTTTTATTTTTVTSATSDNVRSRSDVSRSHDHHYQNNNSNTRSQRAAAAAYTSLIGYVSQEDTLLPALTVRQTIEYAARLKLPRAFSRKTIDRIVRQVIRVLRLQQCEHVLIGDGATIRGVSGGEKRRVSIAVELLANPRILCLDEPTSGLDAVSAQHIMEAVVALSRDSPMRAYAPHYFAFQPIVILSIHQPSRQIFDMFDKVLLLSRGISVYCGPAATAAATLEQRLRSALSLHNNDNNSNDDDNDDDGAVPHCTESDNPAEYLMRLEELLDERVRGELLYVETTGQPSPALRPVHAAAAAVTRATNADATTTAAAAPPPLVLPQPAVATAQATRTTARQLRYSDALPSATEAAADADDAHSDDVNGALLAQPSRHSDYVDGACVLRVSGEFRRYYANVYQQLGLLTSRSATCLLTSSHLVVCHAAVVACLASLMCFLYPTQALDLPGSLNRAGSVTFLLLVTAFVSLSTLEQLVTERKLFVLERENGFYSTLPYLLSKVVVDLLPLRVVPAVVLSSVIYFPMGFRVDGGAHFFWFILVTVLFSVSMTLIVMCIGVLSGTFGSAVLLSSVCILWNFVFGGSMVQAETIPGYLRPFKSLSPFFLAFESLMVNELNGQACVFSPTDETGKPSSASIPIMCVQYLANVGLKPARFSTDVMQLALYCFVFLLLAWLLLAKCTRIIR